MVDYLGTVKPGYWTKDGGDLYEDCVEGNHLMLCLAEPDQTLKRMGNVVKIPSSEQQAYREIHKMFKALSPDAKRLFATDIWHATELLEDDDEERDRILKKFHGEEVQEVPDALIKAALGECDERLDGLGTWQDGTDDIFYEYRRLAQGEATFDGQGNLIIMDDDALLFIPVKNVKKAIDLFKEDK